MSPERIDGPPYQPIVGQVPHQCQSAREEFRGATARRLATCGLGPRTTPFDFKSKLKELDAPAGTVRLLTTEAFGISVVAPWAARLRRLHPGIKLELLTNSRKSVFSAREFDLAVTFHQPDLADVLVTRLADYGLGLYASRGYLAGRGGSLTREQLADADFVWFIESLQELPELPFPRSLVPDPRVVFYATSVLGQQAAVAAGTGVGLLPHFVAALDERLVRVLPDEIGISRTSWLVIPTESSRSPATRAVARFLHRISLRERVRLTGDTSGLAPSGQDRPPHRLSAITAGY